MPFPTLFLLLFPFPTSTEDTPPAPPAPVPVVAEATAAESKDKTVGHTQAVPAEEVVTTANAKVEQAAAPVNPPPPAPTGSASSRPWVDYAFLRQQVTMEQVLSHLGLIAGFRGSGHQRRGCCPVHDRAGVKQKTFSVHQGKNVCQCFQAECGVQGNVLDLWAAVHDLPLYEAALDLVATFRLRRNREEEPVGGTR